LGREDAGKGILLQWDSKRHALVQSNLPLGICADGDIRDVLSVENAKREQLVVISKNSDNVQVIKPAVHGFK
jgi:hypothetical protein